MTARRQVEKRVTEFLETCRRQGVKATHQRTEILRELAGSEEHPDAETILARVRQKIPALARHGLSNIETARRQGCHSPRGFHARQSPVRRHHRPAPPLHLHGVREDWRFLQRRHGSVPGAPGSVRDGQCRRGLCRVARDLSEVQTEDSEDR